MEGENERRREGVKEGESNELSKHEGTAYSHHTPGSVLNLTQFSIFIRTTLGSRFILLYGRKTQWERGRLSQLTCPEAVTNSPHPQQPGGAVTWWNLSQQMMGQIPIHGSESSLRVIIWVNRRADIHSEAIVLEIFVRPALRIPGPRVDGRVWIPPPLRLSQIGSSFQGARPQSSSSSN